MAALTGCGESHGRMGTTKSPWQNGHYEISMFSDAEVVRAAGAFQHTFQEHIPTCFW
jgi:hypothetical protein